LLGALEQLREFTNTFVVSIVRLSEWRNAAPTERIFMKFDI